MVQRCLVRLHSVDKGIWVTLVRRIKSQCLEPEGMRWEAKAFKSDPRTRAHLHTQGSGVLGFLLKEASAIPIKLIFF